MSLNSSWRIPPIGLFIVCIVLTLTFLGLVVLFSASQAMYEGNPYVLLRKQIIWLLLASLAGGSVMVLDLEAIRKYARDAGFEEQSAKQVSDCELVDAVRQNSIRSILRFSIALPCVRSGAGCSPCRACFQRRSAGS